MTAVKNWYDMVSDENIEQQKRKISKLETELAQAKLELMKMIKNEKTYEKERV